MVGISQFSGGNVLSHSAEKNRTGIHQCFTDPGIEKFYSLEESFMIFCRNFSSHSGEKNAEESFRVSFSLGYRKNLCIRGVYHDILSKNFSSHSAEKMFMNLMCFTDFGYR